MQRESKYVEPCQLLQPHLWFNWWALLWYCKIDLEILTEPSAGGCVAVLSPPVECVIGVAENATVSEPHRERGQMPVHELEETQQRVEHMQWWVVGGERRAWIRNKGLKKKNWLSFVIENQRTANTPTVGTANWQSDRQFLFVPRYF